MYLLELKIGTVSLCYQCRSNLLSITSTYSGDDRHCMLDSGANVMVIPKMEGMVGDELMCSIVETMEQQA